MNIKCEVDLGGGVKLKGNLYINIGVTGGAVPTFEAVDVKKVLSLLDDIKHQTIQKIKEIKK